jgi:hypothetical protein
MVSCPEEWGSKCERLASARKVKSVETNPSTAAATFGPDLANLAVLQQQQQQQQHAPSVGFRGL